MYYVYILKLSNNTFYAGSTANLKERFKSHQQGNNQSTKAFRPMSLIYYCAFPTKTNAIRFEMYLKSGSGIAFRNKHLIQK